MVAWAHVVTVVPRRTVPVAMKSVVAVEANIHETVDPKAVAAPVADPERTIAAILAVRAALHVLDHIAPKVAIALAANAHVMVMGGQEAGKSGQVGRRRCREKKLQCPRPHNQVTATTTCHRSVRKILLVLSRGLYVKTRSISSLMI